MAINAFVNGNKNKWKFLVFNFINFVLMTSAIIFMFNGTAHFKNYKQLF